MFVIVLYPVPATVTPCEAGHTALSSSATDRVTPHVWNISLINRNTLKEETEVRAAILRIELSFEQFVNTVIKIKYHFTLFTWEQLTIQFSVSLLSSSEAVKHLSTLK